MGCNSFHISLHFTLSSACGLATLSSASRRCSNQQWWLSTQTCMKEPWAFREPLSTVWYHFHWLCVCSVLHWLCWDHYGNDKNTDLLLLMRRSTDAPLCCAFQTWVQMMKCRCVHIGLYIIMLSVAAIYPALSLNGSNRIHLTFVLFSLKCSLRAPAKTRPKSSTLTIALIMEYRGARFRKKSFKHRKSSFKFTLLFISLLSSLSVWRV